MTDIHLDRIMKHTYISIKFQLEDDKSAIFENPYDVFAYFAYFASKSMFMQKILILKKEFSNDRQKDCYEYVDSNIHFKSIIKCRLCRMEDCLRPEQFVTHVVTSHTRLVENDASNLDSRFGINCVTWLDDNDLS